MLVADTYRSSNMVTLDFIYPGIVINVTWLRSLSMQGQNILKTRVNIAGHSCWASGPDNWILTSVVEVHGVWNLATNYHGAYFLSFLQTSSLAGTDSSRTCTRLCRRDFVLHKSLFLITYICELLTYVRHLSTYPPSNCDRRCYSKW